MDDSWHGGPTPEELMARRIGCGDRRPLVDPVAPTQAVFLFVGGPLDGRRLRVEMCDHGQPPDFFPCHTFTPALRPSPADPLTPALGIYTYRFLRVAAADKKVVALYAGEDVTDPLARLLAGYKPEAADVPGA